MKTLQRVFPIIAIVVVLGGAIYYVQASAPQRPEPAQQVKAPAASQSLLPPSDRYANTNSAGS